MTLEHVHGPAFLVHYREAQRAVLDRAEEVAIGRTSGTLTAEAIDRLAEADRRLQRFRLAYIDGTSPAAQ